MKIYKQNGVEYEEIFNDNDCYLKKLDDDTEDIYIIEFNKTLKIKDIKDIKNINFSYSKILQCKFFPDD